MPSQATLQRLYKSRSEVKAIEEERQRQAEEEAKRKTFDLGRMAIPAITSMLTANPTPFLLAAGGEGARAATGSDLDLATAAQGLEKFLPTKPIESAAQTTTEAMRGASRISPPPTALRGDLSPMESYFGRMAGNVGYKTQTSAEQNQADLIAKGSLKPKSLTYEGISYEKPQKTLLEEIELAKAKESIKGMKNWGDKGNDVFRKLKIAQGQGQNTLANMLRTLDVSGVPADELTQILDTLNIRTPAVPKGKNKISLGQPGVE